jgi:hypothetical protein
MAPVDLDDLRRLLAAAHGLTAVTTLRPDGSVSASLVNAGVGPHPVTGADVIGFVVRGAALKLPRFRRQRQTTVLVHAGWEWASASGAVDLAGPDDPLDGLDPQALPGLLRTVFRAAGGTHDDWDAYDRAMVEERRTAVLVEPTRLDGVVRPAGGASRE